MVNLLLKKKVIAITFIPIMNTDKNTEEKFLEEDISIHIF